MGKKKGRAAKKAKQVQEQRGEDEEVKNAPHSFVIPRGKVGKNVQNLIKDMRKVMSPYTAEHLKVHKRNVMKDFVAMAGPLGVSHMLMFTKSEVSVNLRICRLPRGPTLTFKVDSYTPISDLAHHIRRHDVNESHFKHHALLVMNNFSKDINHLKLTASMFQNMFPSININKVKLRNIRRVVLVNYDEEKEKVDFRHYHLRVVPLGVSKSVKKLQKKNVPKLSQYNDISQFLLNPGALSESEAELDGEHNSLELPQRMSGTGNTQNEQSAIRLKEIGPRMSLSLTKITEGFCDGNVLYHKYDTLTDEQKAEIVKRKEARKKLKAKRTAEQNERVRLKKQAKQSHKERSQKGQQADGGSEDDGYAGADNDADSSDGMNDADYYEQEVGSKPDRDLFSDQRAKKRAFTGKNKSDGPAAKRKFSGKTVEKSARGGKDKSKARTASKSQKFSKSTAKPFTGGAGMRQGKSRGGKVGSSLAGHTQRKSRK